MLSKGEKDNVVEIKDNEVKWIYRMMKLNGYNFMGL